MPDPENPTTPQDATAPKDGEAGKKDDAPKPISKEDIAAATSEAVAKALEVQNAQHAEDIQKREAVEQAQADRLEAIARAAGGDPGGNPDKEALEAFLRNPIATQDELVKQATREALRIFRTEQQENTHFKNVIDAEINRRESVGLEVSDADKNAYAAYYGLTDSSLPPEERFKQAVKQHDDYLENLGLGNFEARVKAASSVPSKNASAPGGPKENSFDEEAELKKEMQGRVDHFNRAYNISD